MKKILFKLHQAPNLSYSMQERLDEILFAASFGFKVSLFFENENSLKLFQCKNTVFGSEQQIIAKHLSVLPCYDVEEIFMLQDLNIQLVEDLPLAVTTISSSKLSEFFTQFDFIMSL